MDTGNIQSSNGSMKYRKEAHVSQWTQSKILKHTQKSYFLSFLLREHEYLDFRDVQKAVQQQGALQSSKGYITQTQKTVSLYKHYFYFLFI